MDYSSRVSASFACFVFYGIEVEETFRGEEEGVAKFDRCIDSIVRSCTLTFFTLHVLWVARREIEAVEDLPQGSGKQELLAGQQFGRGTADQNTRLDGSRTVVPEP